MTKPLTTLDAVKAELEITDSSSDSILQRYIHVVSDRFVAACNRNFHYVEDHEEQLSDAASAYLSPSDFDNIQSVSKITYDGTEVPAAHYTLQDNGLIVHESGSWEDTRYLIEGPLPYISPQQARPLYVVTYTAGYVTPKQEDDDPSLTRNLPYDLEEAIIKEVAKLYFQQGRDTTITAMNVLSAQVRFQNTKPGEDLVTQAFKDAVKKYSRQVIA
jgi:hypothetical protein